MIYPCLGLFVAGSLFDIATGREHWPYSPYGMYSSVERARSLQTLRLIGITRAGSQFPLVANRYLWPFNRSSLRWTLGRLNESADRAQRLPAALEDCLRRYEERRRAGRHDGPPLQALGLYRVWWTLDPLARNVDRPDRQELLMQVRAPIGGGG